jgi:hypothetical protein
MKEAQAKFIADQVLKELGGKFTKVAPDKLPVLERILYDIGLEFNKEINNNLKEQNAIASGGLADISVPQVYENANGSYTLAVGYPINSRQAKYYDYVNKGVKGTKNKKSNLGTPYKFKPNKKSIPYNVIEKWLQFNKLRSISIKKYTKLGVETKLVSDKKSMASAIAIGIHRNGLRATKYFDDALKIMQTEDFRIALSKAIEGDFTIKFNQITEQ